MKLYIAYSTNLAISVKFMASALRKAYMLFVFISSIRSGCELSKLFKPAKYLQKSIADKLLNSVACYKMIKFEDGL